MKALKLKSKRVYVSTGLFIYLVMHILSFLNPTSTEGNLTGSLFGGMLSKIGINKAKHIENGNIRKPVKKLSRN